MEKYRISLCEDFGVGPFVKRTRMFPVEESFFTSFGLGLLESLTRLQGLALSTNSWTKLVNELNVSKKFASLSNSAVVSEIKLIEELIIELRSHHGQSALDQLHHYFSMENYLSAISHSIKFILSKGFKSQNFASKFQLKTDYLKYLSDRFQVFICIYESENITQTTCTTALPAVLLFKESTGIAESFSNLYHSAMFREFNQVAIGKFPFVWEFGKIKQIDNSLQVNPGEDLTQLIDILAEIALQVRLEENDRKTIEGLYKKCGFTNEKLDLLCENHPTPSENLSDFLVKSLKNCVLCKKISNSGINIPCPFHDICLECRSNQFVLNFSSFCHICYREFSNSELQIISSFSNS